MMHRLLTKTRSLNTTRRMTIPAGSRLFRSLFSTTPSFTPENPPIRRQEFSNHNLYSRLSLVRSTGEKVSDVLDQILRNNNNQLKREDLVQCIMMLRKHGHYQLCLEILEWMEKGQIGHSALHLNMICEVKGIDEAEEFFFSLPPDEQNRATYGALLHGYCFKKMIDKALALFNQMDEMNLVSSEVAYAHLISLYMKVDQPEKVPPLIQEMKQRNIPISCVCYQPWILSYACLNDREGIERVMKEVRLQRSIKDEWLIYVTFASAYLKTGQFEKVDQTLILLEEILDSSFDNPDNVGYHILINLYATLGRLESVNRIWEKLKSRSDDYDNLCYLTMLQALTKLGNMELLKKCFMEWNSNYKSYDARLLTVVIGAYLRHDWFDEANLILKDAADGGGDKACAAHVTFVDYYLEKRQIDPALKHLEVALANQWAWHSFAGRLNRFFEYFIEEKDVDGAEHYCQMLERSQPLVPTTYLGLLQTYAAAGKTAPDIRKRMEQSAINIGTELEELVEKILEWMEKEKFEYEYALHLNILCKVKGICEAEKYFDSLPPEVKKGFVYGALLNCYCTGKMTDKALALFEKMNEMKYTNDLAFINLMGLFMKVDEPEKVPPLVEEMKRRNIPLSLISYQTWMHSYSCLNDLEGVERVMDEAQRQENIKYEWKLYCNFASAYVKAGQYQKAVPSLKKVEEILGDSNYPDRIGYHHLISLYAGVGDLESVIRAWDKMKSKFPACNNLSYFTMLHILSKLDNIELLKKYFQDWNSKYKSYDLRLPTIVIGAYLRHDMLEEAELLLKDVTDRSGNKVWKAHALFMDYFLGKRQIDSALRHLEKAMANQWKPLAGSFDPFIEYLIEQKDVNNAEQFFHLIKKDQSLLSTAYLGLLQIYAAAGKIAPEMRERMEQDGANIGTEHEELLEKNSNLMEASCRGASSHVSKKRRY